MSVDDVAPAVSRALLGLDPWTDELYEAAILAADSERDRAIAAELARRQSRGAFGNAFDRYPQLVYHTPAAARAEEQLAAVTLAIERSYLRAQGFDV